MPALFSNNASATLASSITSAATSITVSTGMGSLFPALTSGLYFYATLTDSSNNLEIVKVTGRAADVLTVVRAQEGTTARAYAAADKIELRITAAVLNNFAQLDGTQTLTGDKTFTGTNVYSGANSFSGAVTFTGAITASAASLILPVATTPAQTDEGSIVWDSNDDLLTIGTGTGRKTLVDLDSAQTLANKTFTGSVIGLGANSLTTTTYTFKESGGKLLFIASPSVTASISGTVMTVTAADAGAVTYGCALSGSGVAGGTTAGAQLTSTETAVASPTYVSGGAIGADNFTVNDVTGVLVDQMISGLGIPTGTYVRVIDGATVYLGSRTNVPVTFTIQAAGTYSVATAGIKGTYTVSPSQTVASTTITSTKTVASLNYAGTLTALAATAGTP